MAGYSVKDNQDRQACVAGDSDQVFALKADGTVVRAGAKWDVDWAMPEGEELQEELEELREMTHDPNLDEDDLRELNHWSLGDADPVARWRDIVRFSCKGLHIAGITSKGRVLAAGENSHGECEVDDWRDIVDVACASRVTVGLKADGEIVMAGEEERFAAAREWKQIKTIAAGSGHLVGIDREGRIHTAGSNFSGQRELDGWEDIVQIACGDQHTVGLKSDGTVVAAGSNEYGQCNVSGWTDIVFLAGSATGTVGVKADGRAVMSGGWNVEGANGVENWTDIVTAACTENLVIGVKSDGTAVWGDRLGRWQEIALEGLEDWKDLKVPGGDMLTEQEKNFLWAQMEAAYRDEFYVKKVYEGEYGKTDDSYEKGIIYLVRYRETVSGMNCVSFIQALVRKDEAHTLCGRSSVSEDARVSLDYEEDRIGEKYVTLYPLTEVTAQKVITDTNRLYRGVVESMAKLWLSREEPEPAPLFATEEEMERFFDSMTKMAYRKVPFSGEGWEASH